MNFENESIISFTMDIDWVPDKVLAYELDILSEYGVNSTMFMTHKVEIDTGNHELGIHPNFTSLDLEKHLEDRLNEYPGTKGSRSHSLFFTERLRVLYKKYDIEYDSNFMMYRQHNIKPFLISPTTLEIPLFWMDNFYIEMEELNLSFLTGSLDVKKPGLKVFNFHPIHVYLNTCSMQQYETAKKYYHEPAHLIKYRNLKQRGVKDIFIELLKYVKTEKLKVVTLSEINNNFGRRKTKITT